MGQRQFRGFYWQRRTIQDVSLLSDILVLLSWGGREEGTDWQPEILLSSKLHRKHAEGRAARTQVHSSPVGPALSHSARTWNRAKGTLISVHVMKQGGSKGTAPLILNLGITWRWVLSFRLQPLYHKTKTRRYITEVEWAPTAGIDILENIKFSYMSGIGHRRARYTTSSVPPDFRCLTVDSRVLEMTIRMGWQPPAYPLVELLTTARPSWDIMTKLRVSESMRHAMLAQADMAQCVKHTFM